MSASYYWRPVAPPPPPGGMLSLGMADLLARHFFGDWAGDRSEVAGHVLDESHTGWLTGVRDASDDEEIRGDAAGLLAGIAKHGQIEIEVEH